MNMYSLFKDFNYSFLDSEEGREKNIEVCISPAGDLARNPSMSSHWELNWPVTAIDMHMCACVCNISISMDKLLVPLK